MAVILYAGAHQDDIPLTHLSLRAHLQARGPDGASAAHTIHTLTCTTGENSGIRPPDMPKPEFAAARDDEDIRALRALGVPFGNIHLGDSYLARPQDGFLTVELAEAQLTNVINTLALAYPDQPIWVKTHTNLGAQGVQHSDHRNLGQAAVNLLTQGVIMPNGLRQYVEPYQLTAFKAANPGLSIGPEDAGNHSICTKSLLEYKAQDGVGLKFGFGYRSVPSAFETVLSELRGYWHVPVM